MKGEEINNNRWLSAIREMNGMLMRRYIVFILAILICQNVLSSERKKSYTRENVQESIDAIRFVSISKKMAREALEKHNIFFKDEETFEKFTEENLNSILAAIKLLPKNFQFFFPRLHLGSYNAAPELGRYMYQWGDNDIRNNYISFTEYWSTSETYVQIGTVIHEIGHLFGVILADVQESSFWQNSQCPWEVDMGISWRSQCLGHHISTYSTINPWEDWAESFTAYVLNFRELKYVAPKKYDFINSIFTSNSEVLNISSVLKTVPLRERKFITKESSLYKLCLNNFGKKLKNECLGFSITERTDLMRILDKKLGAQLPQFISGLFQKITLNH
jgi:hypothetical protein